jgi:MFS family permease
VNAQSHMHQPLSPLVLGLSVATTVSWGILFYAFALFLEPMRADLGWSKAALNGALSIGLLAAGLAAIPVGRAIDHGHARIIMSAGGLFGAALVLAWSQVGSYPVFLAIFVAIGIAQAATLYEPVFAVVTANVRDYKRAIIFISFVGGFASTIFLPLSHVLIETQGWRVALVVLAAIQFVLSGLVYALILRRTRGSLQDLPPAPDSSDKRTHLQRAAKRPAFRALVVVFTGYGLMWAAITFHLIPLLTERGVALDQIVFAIAIFGPCQVAGRVILFVFGSGLSARTMGKFVVLLPLVAAIMLATVASWGFWGLVAFAVVHGLGNGMITIVRGAGVAEILGTEGYGQVSGAITLANQLAKAAAPLGFALLWEWTGYGPILVIWIVVMAIAAAAFWVAAADRTTSA